MILLRQFLTKIGRPMDPDRRRCLTRRRKDYLVATQRYIEVNHQEIRRRMKEAKEKWIADRCKEVDSGFGSNNSKELFDTLKLLTCHNRYRQHYLNIRMGNFKHRRKHTFTHASRNKYYTAIYKYKLKTHANVLKNENNIQPGEAPTLKQEVEKVRRIVKIGKISRCRHYSDQVSSVISAPTVMASYVRQSASKTGHCRWLGLMIISLPKTGNTRLCLQNMDWSIWLVAK